ncbi:hypothetical protein V8C34DRAFT_280761 [Trichoderma compactum]
MLCWASSSIIHHPPPPLHQTAVPLCCAVLCPALCRSRPLSSHGPLWRVARLAWAGRTAGLGLVSALWCGGRVLREVEIVLMEYHVVVVSNERG